MKFKLGDFVRFVDERREGYITRVINEQMVAVTGDDDFEIPVAVNNLTLVHGHGHSHSDPAAAPALAEAARFVDRGIFLAVMTDPKMASVAHFHLVNTTSFQLLMTLQAAKNDRQKGEFAGIVAPGGTARVYTASLTELQSWPRIVLHLLRFHPADHLPQPPLTYSEKFTAKDFSTAKKTVPVLLQPGWLFALDPEEVKVDAVKLKESFFKPAEEKTGVPRPSAETDLHIEKLTNDYAFMTSAEMLTVQLNAFKKALDAAIVHKLPSIIFIHGTGNGTLRNEIHKLAGKHPGVKTFLDARKERFGYGGTEIQLK